MPIPRDMLDPAFPHVRGTDNYTGEPAYYPGVTILDYFAAKAMATLLDRARIHIDDDWRNLCPVAYAVARGMVQTRALVETGEADAKPIPDQKDLLELIRRAVHDLEWIYSNHANLGGYGVAGGTIRDCKKALGDA